MFTSHSTNTEIPNDVASADLKNPLELRALLTPKYSAIPDATTHTTVAFVIANSQIPTCWPTQTVPPSQAQYRTNGYLSVFRFNTTGGYGTAVSAGGRRGTRLILWPTGLVEFRDMLKSAKAVIDEARQK